MKLLSTYIIESNEEQLLKHIGYNELFNEVNEGFIDDLFSDASDKLILGLMKEIKRLSILLVKKISLNAAQEVYKQFKKLKEKFKSSHDFRVAVFLHLLFLVGGTYNYINTYNDNPIVPNSHIIQKGDTITYKDSVSTVNVSKDSLNNPTEYNYQTSIRVLQQGETAPTYYKGSPELKKLIAEKMEGCKLHIYSTVAGHPLPKSKKDMLHMQDLTIGYGHKLTAQERKTWRFDKTITKEEAWDLFLKDYEKHEQVANDFIKRLPYYNKVEFGQGFIDAMISIRYNSSKELLLNTRPEFWTTLSKCKLGEHELDSVLFNKALDYVTELWANKSAAKGLTKRRQLEQAIMKQPFGQPIDKTLYNLNVY